MADSERVQRGVKSLSRGLPLGIVSILAAGAILLGAVHPWAYRPLAAATVLLSVWMFWRAGCRNLHMDWVMPGALILLPVLAQILPIPLPILESVAPSNAALVRMVELDYGSRALHSVSTAPELTLRH